MQKINKLEDIAMGCLQIEAHRRKKLTEPQWHVGKIKLCMYRVLPKVKNGGVKVFLNAQMFPNLIKTIFSLM